MSALESRLFELRWLAYAALAAVIVLLFSACGTVNRITSGPDFQLKAVASMGFAVDRAMDASWQLYRAGVIDEVARQRISKIHAKWQPVWASAYRAARDGRSAPPPELAELTEELLITARMEGVMTP